MRVTNSKINLLIIGDSKTGKTSFINRYKTGAFPFEYIPTIGVISSTLQFRTNRGVATVEIYESSNPYYKHLHYNIHAAIVMFDNSIPESYNKAYKHIQFIELYYPSIPIVLCANKMDLNYIDMPRYLEYFPISSKTLENIDKPINHLLRVLSKDDSVFLTDSAPSTPLLLYITINKQVKRLKVQRWIRNKRLCDSNIFKSQLCRNKNCQFGQKCMYAHSELELRTPLCFFGSQCRVRTCKYKHD